MRLEALGAELLDRKIVEADEPHASRDERARRRGRDVRKVFAEAPARVCPERGVARLEEYARRARDGLVRDVALFDRVRVTLNLDDRARELSFSARSDAEVKHA